jgi:hypothetical protein
MLTRFGISVGDEDRWGYQSTLATVDQVDYHMPGLLKKEACITRPLSSAKKPP